MSYIVTSLPDETESQSGTKDDAFYKRTHFQPQTTDTDEIWGAGKQRATT
jgi:hypothetical protein